MPRMSIDTDTVVLIDLLRSAQEVAIVVEAAVDQGFVVAGAGKGSGDTGYVVEVKVSKGAFLDATMKSLQELQKTVDQLRLA